jgi:hypothetical protein
MTAIVLELSAIIREVARVSEIKVVRLLVEEVSTPTMDGSPGSALYNVPFELSALPPMGWADAFMNAWDHPSSYTSRHRPGIAAVYGAKIQLNGTTIEEVEQVHKSVLLAAVEEANLCVQQSDIRRQQEIAAQLKRETEHRQQVAEAARKVTFD